MARGRHAPMWADQMNERMTLEQAWKSWDRAMVAAERSDLTREAYARYVARFIRYLQEDGHAEPKATHLTAESVRGFVVWLKEQAPAVVNNRVMPKGPQSLRAHVVCIKAFAHWMMENGVFKHDPVARVKNPSVREPEVVPFTKEEVKLIVAEIGSGPFATRNRAIVYWMLATGTRAAEVCSLKVANLNLKERAALVTGKGNKQRTVVFDRATARYLALYLAERPEGPAGKGCVFVSASGAALNPGALYGIIRGLGDRAGVPNAHPHRLRHQMATTFLEAYPGQVFQLQTLLGHTGLGMTRRYVKAAHARQIMSGPSIIETLGLR